MAGSAPGVVGHPRLPGGVPDLSGDSYGSLIPHLGGSAMLGLLAVVGPSRRRCGWASAGWSGWAAWR